MSPNVIKYSEEPVKNLLDIYQKTAAGKFMLEKDVMVEELKKYGINKIKKSYIVEKADHRSIIDGNLISKALNDVFKNI